LTPLLLQIVARCGWISFHGPMVAADFARGLTDDESASLLQALAGRPLDVPLAGTVPAEIAGPLLGGCLSLLAATVATPYAVDLEGSLLFFEDVEEPPFRLDRLLTHLDLSGTLAGVRAMILGHLSLFPKGVEPSAWNGEVTGRSVFSERAAAFGKPIVLGCPAGHDRPNWTLPLGAWARLVPEGRLSFGFVEE
jgi:muramoyltetrapeptide carboxypeptidase